MLGKNNIFNIRYQWNNNWQGQTGFSVDSKGNKWCNFSSESYAIRTCFYLLHEVYMKRYGYRSLFNVLSKFAPPTENDTANYTLFILRRLKQFNGENHLSSMDMVYHKHLFPVVISAMAKIETGTDISSFYVADILNNFGYGTAISYKEYWYKNNNYHE